MFTQSSLKKKMLVVYVSNLVSLVASFLSFHFHGGDHYLSFDPAACEPFVRIFDTDVCWHIAAVEL